MSFSFLGKIPSSKSLMNRALIVKSFFPEFRIVGQSSCEDVKDMQQAVDCLINGKKQMNCGHAGTVLRFLAPRLAREKGEYLLKGSIRLFERPQQPLLALLHQLGAHAEIADATMRIKANEWKLMGDGLHLNSTISSQFASGVILSAWKIDFPLYISYSAKISSKSYLDMTVEFVKQLGMKIEITDTEIFIPSHQKIEIPGVSIEPDMSSAFAVAAMAALRGEAILLDFPEKSLQPDIKFVEILKLMGVDVVLNNKKLIVRKAKKFNSLSINISNSPDLFPVLSVLCAFAEGESLITGIETLKYKESNRLEKTIELLNAMGVDSKTEENSIKIIGRKQAKQMSEFDFDPDQDHRMAMAAGIAKQCSVAVNILNPHVVDKSFPEFFQIIGVVGL